MIRIPHPPGRRIDIGGRRLHVRELGGGATTVVLEAGAGGWSSHWGLVPARIAPFARVLAYDRAGLGWSEPAPPPRTAARMVDDLAALLAALEVAGDVVLVAHSFGATVARLAAARLSPRVAGVVLVDGWHDAMAAWERARGVDAGAPGWVFRAQLVAARLGLLRALTTIVPAPDPPWPIAVGTWREILALSSTSTYARAILDEHAAGGASDAEVAAVTRLDVPVRVLAARRTLRPEDAPAGYPVAAHNDAWLDAARALAALSDDAELTVLDGTDHQIPLRRPDAVVAAVRGLVAGIAPRP